MCIYIYVIYIYTRIFGPRFARPRFFPESSPSPDYMCTGKFKILPAQSTGILDICITKICVASYHAFKISKYSRAQNPQVWNTRWAQHSKYPRAPRQNNRWVQKSKVPASPALKILANPAYTMEMYRTKYLRARVQKSERLARPKNANYSQAQQAKNALDPNHQNTAVQKTGAQTI